MTQKGIDCSRGPEDIDVAFLEEKLLGIKERVVASTYDFLNREFKLLLSESEITGWTPREIVARLMVSTNSQHGPARRAVMAFVYETFPDLVPADEIPVPEELAPQSLEFPSISGDAATEDPIVQFISDLPISYDMPYDTPDEVPRRITLANGELQTMPELEVPPPSSAPAPESTSSAAPPSAIQRQLQDVATAIRSVRFENLPLTGSPDVEPSIFPHSELPNSPNSEVPSVSVSSGETLPPPSIFGRIQGEEEKLQSCDVDVTQPSLRPYDVAVTQPPPPQYPQFRRAMHRDQFATLNDITGAEILARLSTQIVDPDDIPAQPAVVVDPVDIPAKPVEVVDPDDIPAQPAVVVDPDDIPAQPAVVVDPDDIPAQPVEVVDPVALAKQTFDLDDPADFKERPTLVCVNPEALAKAMEDVDDEAESKKS